MVIGMKATGAASPDSGAEPGVTYGTTLGAAGTLWRLQP